MPYDGDTGLPMTTGAGDGPSAAGVGAEAPGAEPDPCVEGNENAANDEKSRLTALEGLAALSLDALSSVAYGPEAIVVVLVAAGAPGPNYTLPVTLTIVARPGILSISYPPLIAPFPPLPV